MTTQRHTTAAMIAKGSEQILAMNPNYQKNAGYKIVHLVDRDIPYHYNVAMRSLERLINTDTIEMPPDVKNRFFPNTNFELKENEEAAALIRK